MKTTFFLDLDHTGVRLRYGTGTEFPVIGEIALDDPHFETRLEDLRREAEALSDGPLETVLTIPQSEILFTSIEMAEEAGDDAARKTRIETELEGMTPYALDDLVYDWKKLSKSKIAVAAAARETLDQAETFAVSHGFNPQGFTTEPKKGLFSQRPDFGKTGHALSPPPEAAPAAAAPVTRIADLFDGDEADHAQEDDAANAMSALPGPDAAHAADPAPRIDESRAQFTAPMPDRGEATPPAEPENPAAPLPVEPEGAEPPTSRSAEASAPAAKEAPVAFTSRRVGEAGPTTDASRFDDVASRIAVLPDGGSGPRPQSAPQAAPEPAPRPQSRPPGPNSAPVPSVRKVAPPAETSAASLAPGSTAAARDAPASTGSARPKTEAEQMTVFGARKSQRRNGMSALPVVIGLLVALAIAVGIWASFFMLTPTDEALLGPGATPDGAVVVSASPDEPSSSAPEAEIPETVARQDSGTTPGPEDPLRRPEGADEAGRYAAIGIDASAPDGPAAPSADRVEDVRIAAVDVDLRAQDRVARLAEIDDDIDMPSAPLPGDDAPATESEGADEDDIPAAVTEEVQEAAPVPSIRPAAAPDRAVAAPTEAAAPVQPADATIPDLRPRARPSEAAEVDEQGEESTDIPVSVLTAEADSPRPAARPEGEEADAIAVTLVPQSAERPETSPRARPEGAATIAVVEPDRTDTARRDGSAAASAAAAALAGLVPSGTPPVARSVTPPTRPAAPVEVAQASAIARPSGPTSGSVASRATIADAINLRQVNLMGVYGSASNRRALIRLPNGRFEKVQVGDRVDGGRVQAIDDNRLSYVKSGRQVVLEMPGG